MRVCERERKLTCPALGDQFAGTSRDRVHHEQGQTPGNSAAPRGDSKEAWEQLSRPVRSSVDRAHWRRGAAHGAPLRVKSAAAAAGRQPRFLLFRSSGKVEPTLSTM